MVKKVVLLGLFLAGFFAAQAIALSVEISPEFVFQGKCFSINVSGEGTTKVRVGFLGRTFECYPMRGGFKSIIGVPCEQNPGEYEVELFITNQDGQEEQKSYKLKIKAAKFPIASFWLKPAKKKLLTRDLINQEWARIEKTLVVEDPFLYWAGTFSFPASGRLSMLFGAIERINGKKSGQHRGLDIAVPSGTKVFAPNDGKVVFAQKLKAFGGTMVIDHGQGIHTLYFHLSKLMAEAGDEVDKGDIIALSGNSGISSGAHLHWGMSVHNLRVDPLQWTKYEI